MFPAGIYYVQTRGCASSVRDIGGKSMIIAVQRCSGEVEQTQNTQWLCPQSTCKSKNLNKNAAFKKVRLDALLQREQGKTQALP